MKATSGHPGLLPLYVAGSLDRDEADAIAAHLERCPECRAEADALASMRNSLLLRDGSGHVGSEELVSYEEGEMAREPLRRRRVERHLAVCDDCRADLGALERARRVRDALPPLPGPPVTAESPVPAWRSRMIVPLAAAAAVVILTVLIVPGRRTSSDRAPALLPVHRMTFAPPRRGASEARLLQAGEPCSITILLPFGSPGGIYRLHVEGRDGSPVGGFDASIPADGDGSLTVLVHAPVAPGSYRLIVEPLAGAEESPFVYPFEVVPPAARRRGEGAP